MTLDKEELELIYKDYLKCYDLVNRMALVFPDDNKVWTGSTSERLEYLMNKMLNKIDER
jgi:hypothetical protein